MEKYSEDFSGILLILGYGGTGLRSLGSRKKVGEKRGDGANFSGDYGVGGKIFEDCQSVVDAVSVRFYVLVEA